MFDPVYGGVCAACRRLLCAEHLHGAWWRRLVARLTAMGATVCPRCRAGSAGGRGGAAG